MTSRKILRAYVKTFGNRLSSKHQKKHLERRTAASIFELTPLEQRVLLSLTPTIYAGSVSSPGSGPTALYMNVSGNGLEGGNPFTSVVIDWGDGTSGSPDTQTVPLSSSDVFPLQLSSHAYANVGSYKVTATAYVGSTPYYAPLSLDPSFGAPTSIAYSVRTGMNASQIASNGTEAGNGVAIDYSGDSTTNANYGSIFIADDNTGQFGVTNYKPDGSLAGNWTAFSSGGANAVAVDSRGYVLAAGVSNGVFALARFNQGGVLDTTFGSSGTVTTTFGADSSQANAILIQPDGYIVVAGTAVVGGVHHFAAARYTPSGALDTTFGNGGTVLYAFSGNNSVDADSFAQAVGRQHDGDIILGGTACESGNCQSDCCIPMSSATDFAVLQLGSDGSVITSDRSNVGDFTACHPINNCCGIGASLDNGYALVIQSDDNVVLAGSTDYTGGDTNDIAVVRYHSDLSPDTSYADNGFLVKDLGGNDIAYGAALQADGKIVIAGTTDNSPGGAYNDFTLLRFDTSGVPDQTFGNAGIVTTDFSGYADIAKAVAVERDGKIVAVGSSATSAPNPNNPPPTEVAIAQYNPDNAILQGNPATAVAPDLNGGDNFAGGVAAGADGGNPAAAGYTGAVRYNDGSVSLTTTDIPAAGDGLISGFTRTWTDQPGLALASPMGKGELVSQWPTITQQEGGAILVVEGGQALRWFDSNANGTSYTERFYGGDSLSPDGSGGYTFVDSKGNVFSFYGFDASLAASSRGMLKTMTDPAGNLTTLTYSSGILQYSQRIRPSDNKVLEQLTYSYYTSGPSTGLLSSVTMSRLLQNGTFAAVESAAYEYYVAGDTNGQPGDLSRVTVSENGTPVNYDVYRYDSYGRLTYALEGASYERLVAAGCDPMATDCTTLSQYADYQFIYYDYDGTIDNGKVKDQLLQGGRYEYAYAYADDTGSIDLNSWRFKTIETLPDRNTNTIYSNYAGEILLKIYTDVSDQANSALSGLQWDNAYSYDLKGRLTLTAEPSAVTLTQSPAAGQPMMLRDQNGSSPETWYLTSSGKEELDVYDPTTGYLSTTELRQGYQSTPVLQESNGYTSHTAGNGVTIYPLQSSTVYQYGNGTVTQSEITNYSYAWLGNSNQQLSQVITYPVVSTTEHGDGSQVSQTIYYDAFGRVTWVKDADGYVRYTPHDDATGALIESVVDAIPSHYPNPPAGLTGSSSPLNLATIYTIDGFGRTTSVKEPLGSITSTFYVDSASVDETITTPQPLTGSTTPPIQVVRVDRGAGITYVFTASSSGGSLQSLSVSTYSPLNGVLQSRDQYQNLINASYSAPSGGPAGDGNLPGNLQLNLPSSSKYRTTYGFDSMGRLYLQAADTQFTTNNAALTKPQITLTWYDSLGRVASRWTGTDSTNWLSVQSPGTNMTEVSTNVYDNNSVGDGDLTSTTEIPGGTIANRTTETIYDWRDRAVMTESGVGATGVTHPPIIVYTLDNLNETTAVQIYDGQNPDGTFLNLANLTPTTVPAANLRSYTETLFDDRGRVYQTLQHSIAQQTANGQTAGQDLGVLATNTWHDGRGYVIKVQPPGGLVTKTVYDGAGRVVETSETDGGGDSVTGSTNLADAGNVTGDQVVQQVLTTYDGDSNPVFVTTRERWDNITDTGDLKSTDTSTDARISFVGYWYDADDRLTQKVDFGNYGGSTPPMLADGITPVLPDRPTTPNNGWDAFLRTDYQYDAAGRHYFELDPKGIETLHVYDFLGREVTTWQDYGGPNGPNGDKNRGTFEHYDGLGHVTETDSETFQTINGTAAVRTLSTSYTYGVVKDGSKIFINDNSLLSSVNYGAVTNAPTGSTDTETYTGYDAIGDVTEHVMRDGSVHDYTYDVLGGETTDKWSNPSTSPSTMYAGYGSLAYTFDALGRGVLYTTYASDGTTVLNQVERVYDGLGNMTDEYQADGGAVVVGTTPDVHYTYDTSFSSASNYTRLMETVYPDGRALWTGYDATGLDNSISRPDYLADSNYNGNGVATTPQNATGNSYLERISYLGLGQVVTRSLDSSVGGAPYSGQFAMTYENYKDSQGHPLGIGSITPTKDDGGSTDPFDGLDRFGRVIAQEWDTTASRAYAYDADGNLLYAYAGTNIDAEWRSDLYSSNGAPLGSAYDGLNRIVTFQRGVLSSSSSSNGDFDTASRPQIPMIQVDSPYTPPYVETHYREQDWQASGATQWNYDRVPGPTDPSDPHYDTDAPAQRNTFQEYVPSGAGSPVMEQNPNATETDLFVRFDPWGRLMYKTTATGQNPTGSSQTGYTYTYTASANTPIDSWQYEYDALGRRISESDSVLTTTSTFKGTTHLYYDQNGNIIEERLSTNPSPPSQASISNTTLTEQQIWSLAGPNLLVAQDSALGGTTEFGKPNSGLDQRLWVEQGPDASTWQVTDNDYHNNREDYLYSPSGQVTVLKYEQVSGTIFPPPGDFNDPPIPYTTWAWVSPNGNSNFSSFGFRYLWHGGRAELFSDPDVQTGQLIQKFDNLMWLNGQEQDLQAGAPLTEDIYAYQRSGTQSYTWTNVNTDYANNGTQPYWSTPSTSWWGTFGTTLGEDLSNTVTGMGKEIAYRAADFENDLVYNETFWSQYVLNGFNADNVQGYSYYKGSLSNMGQMLDANQTTLARATFSSVPIVGSAYNFAAGEDLLSGRPVHGVDRTAAGFALASDLLLLGDAKAVEPESLADMAAPRTFSLDLHPESAGIQAPSRQLLESLESLGEPICFVAGTPVLIAVDPIPGTVRTASAPLRTETSESGMLSLMSRKEWGLTMMGLGIYGCYIIHRLSELRLRKEAEEELADAEPLEMPFFHLRKRLPRMRFDPYRFSALFSVQPIVAH